jgi:hypothetical protein
MMAINFMVLWIGLMLSPLAAAMAFLITYEEYSHHYADKKKPLRFALEAAGYTFVVFGILSFVVSLLLHPDQY